MYCTKNHKAYNFIDSLYLSQKRGREEILVGVLCGGGIPPTRLNQTQRENNFKNQCFKNVIKVLV